MSLLTQASICITPNGYKEGKLYSVIPSDGSGDMSVTRATTATRVNSAGLVELVPYNLLQYSEQFNNGVWGAVDTTITANTTTAPDGTLTADTMVISSSTSRVFQSTSLGAGTYTASVYVKALSGTPTIQFRMVVDGADITDSIPTTTEWVRHDYTFTASTSMDYFVLRGQSGTGSVAIWGAQLVEGSTAKDYQKTETRLNIPRLDYSNGTCPSLLVEPQRTNLLTWSSSFDNAAWTKVSSTATANTTISPSGLQDADTIAFSSGGYVGQILTSSGAHSYSVYAKYIGTQWLYVQNYNGNDFGAWFDIQNGVVGTIESGVNASIEQAENGFYRCTITMTASSSSSSYWVFFNTTGNGSFTRTGSSYIWGAQLEAGSYATSYIPTTSASVTRNADVISKTGISSLIGQTEGTAFIDLQVDSSFAQANMRFLDISNNTYDNWYFLGLANTNELVLYFRSSATTYVSVIVPFTFGHNKIAFAYANNDYVAYVNGSQVYSTSSLAVGSTSKFTLGNEFDFSSTSKQFINAAALWKERKDNATLAQLTTI
jgi:hypothetical protein